MNKIKNYRKASLILWSGISAMLLAIIVICIIMSDGVSSSALMHSLLIGIISMTYGIYTKRAADRLLSQQ